MKLVWSPESALKTYMDTVRSCKYLNEKGSPEFIAAMAAGWEPRNITDVWSYGEPIGESVGLAIAARNNGVRHVCIVPDLMSKVHYIKVLQELGLSPPPEVVIGDAVTVVSRLEGVEFLVVDGKRKEFTRVLSVAKISPRGAVLVCKNAWHRNNDFRWNLILQKDLRVVKSRFHPVGNGLEIAHVGNTAPAPPPAPMGHSRL